MTKEHTYNPKKHMHTYLAIMAVFMGVFFISSTVFVYAKPVPPPKKQTETEKLIGKAKTLNIGKAKKPADIIGKAIKLIMSIVGSIALVMFVYAGGLWMVAGGDPQQTTKALKTMVWSAIGLIVILSSYSIVNFIFSNTF